MASGKTIVWVLVMIFGASVATREYERSSDVEGPRVERMHPETSDGCVGSHCLQQSDGPVGAMWFGPRLGRRRRSDVKLNPKKIQESSIGEMLVPWTIINTGNERPSGSSSQGVPDDKRQETTFTPRLGRNLEETFSAYEILHNLLSQIEAEEQSEKEQPPPPPPIFAPRLGRNPMSPKLEHELRNLLRKLQM